MPIVIDTETNGLPDWKKPADAKGQPRLAQLAIIAINDQGLILDEQSFYIRPDGWKMQQAATDVNGLTTDFLREHGIPLKSALHIYSAFIELGNFVVAHNAQYDTKVLRGEMRRVGLPDLFEKTRNVCTMRKAQGVILNEKGKKVWPSLDRCREVLGLPLEGGHRGMKDARDALAVYLYLKSKGVDLTPEIFYSKTHEEIKANV
jgi:DNA polymerase-3 subunit epsilon